MAKVKYKQPRRFNPVSFVLLLMALGAGYGAYQFGPPYWRSFRAKEVLKDAAVRFWRAENFDEASKSTILRLKEIGVEDPGARVYFKREGRDMEVRAEYRVVIQHPFIHKITTLEFAPKVMVTKANW